MSIDRKIILDNQPGYPYSPGEVVKGVVKMKTEYEIRFPGILPSLQINRWKVVLHGEAKTSWMKNARRGSPRSGGGAEMYRPITATQDYCNLKLILWERPRGMKRFRIVHHEYPFEFTIPDNVPPSFKGSHGSVVYEIQLCYESDVRSIVVLTAPIRVVPRVDLNNIPTLIQPRRTCQTKDTGLIFKNGVIEFRAKISKQGFIPGETIKLHYCVDNNSTHPVTKIKLKLHRISTFHGQEWISNYGRAWGREGRFMKAMKEEVIAKDKKNVIIAPNSKSGGIMLLKVPNTVVSFKSYIIQVKYKVTIEAIYTSFFKKSVELPLNILIGTIPTTSPPPYPIEEVLNTPPPSYEIAVARMLVDLEEVEEPQADEELGPQTDEELQTDDGPEPEVNLIQFKNC